MEWREINGKERLVEKIATCSGKELIMFKHEREEKSKLFKERG